MNPKNLVLRNLKSRNPLFIELDTNFKVMPKHSTKLIDSK